LKDKSFCGKAFLIGKELVSLPMHLPVTAMMSSVDDGKLRFLDEPSGGAERKQVRPKGN
jgi:hypothetical protein